MKSKSFVVFKHRPVLYSTDLYQTQFAFLITFIVNCSLIFFVQYGIFGQWHRYVFANTTQGSPKIFRQICWV